MKHNRTQVYFMLCRITGRLQGYATLTQAEAEGLNRRDRDTVWIEESDYQRQEAFGQKNAEVTHGAQ